MCQPLHVNIMHMPIKLSICTYTTYTNCRTMSWQALDYSGMNFHSHENTAHWNSSCFSYLINNDHVIKNYTLVTGSMIGNSILNSVSYLQTRLASSLMVTY